MSDQPSQMPPPPQYWTQPRAALYSWLEGESPALASLYKAAVLMVNDRAFPARLRLVGHAVREISNRLPDALTGTTSKQVQYVQLVDEIQIAWDSAGFQIEDAILDPSASRARTTADAPVSVLRRVESLIREHRAGRRRAERKSEDVFRPKWVNSEVASVALKPISDNWAEIVKFFEECAHEGRSDVETSQGESVLEAKFQRLERILQARAAEFFKPMEELRGILDAANSRAS